MALVVSPPVPAINRGARHTLFVEGKFDADVLTTFFKTHPLGDNILHVEPLGPSFSNRAAAEALHRHHPEYYFLIDRDHCDDAEVERSWKNFPDPTTKNILIWPRRELESYFLIPEYLRRSPHLNKDVSELELRKRIREACQKRLYLDAANLVITGLREDFKRAWVYLFHKTGDFPSREVALQRLHGLDVLARRRDEFAAAIAPNILAERLDHVLAELTGSQPALDDAHGQWRERLCAKDVMKSVINSCFAVRSAPGSSLRGAFLQGYDREREVARALVKLPLADQPDDLRALHGLLTDRLRP